MGRNALKGFSLCVLAVMAMAELAAGSEPVRGSGASPPARLPSEQTQGEHPPNARNPSQRPKNDRLRERPKVIQATLLQEIEPEEQTGSEGKTPLPVILPIPRVLPPPGIEIPPALLAEWETRLKTISGRLERLPSESRIDAELFFKAVAFALRFGEFYVEADFAKANWALDQAEERLAAIERSGGERSTEKLPWSRKAGLIVRGFRSRIDDSVQPYGLVIPEGHAWDRPAPLYVWLHGRGDKATDLHFVFERARKKGEIAPPGAIVLHPFGRQCLGYKSAGETDVLEAVEEVQKRYRIDPERIVLIGFSMGGAGAWHLGAHFPQRWRLVSPGAGFAETARYQKLDPASVPEYERLLWGQYDVPVAVRNLFNLPVIAYSGEIDPQIQAARVMEEAFLSHGKKLTHLIGPETAHKYHPETLAELQRRIQESIREERPAVSPKFHLQTRTLKYAAGREASFDRLQQHWLDSRIDGEFARGRLAIRTQNVRAFRLASGFRSSLAELQVDGQAIPSEGTDWNAREGETVLQPIRLERTDPPASARPKWRLAASEPVSPIGLEKRPSLQGPIDDAFTERFLVVLPSGKSPHPAVQQWAEFERAHFLDRWGAAFRGIARTIRDTELEADPKLAAGSHLILWGDPASNATLRRLLPKLPIAWTSSRLEVAGKKYDPAKHVPLLIFPRPDSPDRYLVINSGPTFRESHDKTNSQQNPKLPDWAVLDLSTPPDGLSAGKVVAADFFDEQWQIRK